MKTTGSFRFVYSLFILLAKLLIGLLEAVLWVFYFLFHSIVKLWDAVRGIKSFKDGVLHCPHGHEIPIEGGLYHCEACGCTYEGTILKCGNPECGATTPFINCPVCGVSVRNPYRWGRP